MKGETSGRIQERGESERGGRRLEKESQNIKENIEKERKCQVMRR